jgi:hypothetical protein
VITSFITKKKCGSAMVKNLAFKVEMRVQVLLPSSYMLFKFLGEYSWVGFLGG